MRFAQSTELAVDSLLYMAAHPDQPEFSVEDVAHAQNVSSSYLAKIFQQLAKTGLLRSQRGAKGGYTLGRAADKITLLDITRPLEGDGPVYPCRAGLRTCFLGSRCVVVNTFKQAEARMNEVLGDVSLADLLSRLREDSRDLAWLNAEPGAPVVAGNGATPAAAAPERSPAPVAAT